MTTENQEHRIKKERGQDKVTAKEMIPTLSEGNRPAYESDRDFYRGVAVVLGIVVIGSLVGLIWLALVEKEAPQGIIALGSGALGALAGVFASVPKRK
ncbi:MAG: hypothetical protein V4495_11795 [Pseudomonadota bacterium]